MDEAPELCGVVMLSVCEIRLIDSNKLRQAKIS